MTDRIVIITGDDLEHRFVANEICRRFEVEAILIVDPARKRSWKTVLKKSFLEFFDKALWRVFLKIAGDDRAREKALLHVFGRANSEAFHEPHKTLAVGRPKSSRLLREVERLKPDLLVVYGTGIIPDAVLGKASKRALNMHTGISPEYRGAACAFWPIYDGRPEFVGATVHECTSRVDGGEVYFKRRAQLFQTDDLHCIFARAARVGAEGYIQVIERAMEGTLVGSRQDLNQGVEFRGSMRGFRAEIVARLRLYGLRKAWPAQP